MPGGLTGVDLLATVIVSDIASYFVRGSEWWNSYVGVMILPCLLRGYLFKYAIV
jgi:hypothetical protein